MSIKTCLERAKPEKQGIETPHPDPVQGRVVLLSGASGGLGPYIAHTKSIRAEYSDRGVSASSVIPGFIRNAGMYHRASQGSGQQVSRLLGTVSPERVAQAVIRVLYTNKAEVIVNRGPMRLLAGLIEIFPDVGAWIARLTGADKMLQSWANMNELKSPSV